LRYCFPSSASRSGRLPGSKRLYRRNKSGGRLFISQIAGAEEAPNIEGATAFDRPGDKIRARFIKVPQIIRFAMELLSRDYAAALTTTVKNSFWGLLVRKKSLKIDTDQKAPVINRNRFILTFLYFLDQGPCSPDVGEGPSRPGR
jgi:hypothetical protein